MFGKTRQAYYKQSKKKAAVALEHKIVIEVVRKIRKKANSKRWGVRKLHGLVNKELDSMGICIGRDALFDLLRARRMLVRKRKRRYFTTQSHHWLRKYDNLITNNVLQGPNQCWVCDITYVKPAYFLYLITDAYSQKIVGWHLSDNLKTDSAVVALKKAISANKKQIEGLIHHSDRGVQYCANAYVDLLASKHIAISMSNPGSPQENAIAERITEY